MSYETLASSNNCIQAIHHLYTHTRLVTGFAHVRHIKYGCVHIYIYKYIEFKMIYIQK